MNIRFVSRMLAISALALSTEAAWAKDIGFNDMTPQARQVAQPALRSANLKKVETVNYQGRQIYALTFQAPDGSTKYLYLNPDGTYVPNLASTAAMNSSATPSAIPSTVPLSSQAVQLSQVPQPVQNVIRTEVKNGPVSQILQLPNPAGSGVMYEVFFAQPNGQQKIIYLNPDGTYVRNNNSNMSQNAPSWSGFRRQGLSNPSVVSFRQLPAPVQNSFRSEAGGSAIQNIEMGEWNGQTIYQADINKNGQVVRMRVGSNGAILGTTPLQGAPGYVQR